MDKWHGGYSKEGMSEKQRERRRKIRVNRRLNRKIAKGIYLNGKKTKEKRMREREKREG